MDANGKQVGPMAGGVCFFSAGNDSKPWGPPAEYPGAVAVGAIGPNGGRAYYSCYGDWVDVSTTGGDYHYGQIYNTWTNNAYGNFQGTSMACPRATGVAALLVSYFGGPGFTREMLLERMLNAQNPTVSLDVQQIGVMLDATAAFTYGEDRTPAKVTDLSATAKANTITVSWTVTGSDKIPAAGYYLFSGTDRNAVAESTQDKTGKGVKKTTVISTPYSVGETITATLKSLKFETPYWFKVIGFDKQPAYSEASDLLTVTTPANNPPVITPDEPTEGLAIRSFESKEISFTITDPDEHVFITEVTPGSKAETWTETAGGQTVRIDGSKVESGTYQAVITAMDQFDAVSTYTLTYRILPNTPPAAVKDIKLAILQARAKAARLANAEALKLYFFVGGYISKKTRNAKWGSGAIDALSNQLQVELPGLRGFSGTSIKKMRQFYEEWGFLIRPPLAGELPKLAQNNSFPTLSTNLEDVDYTLLLAQNRQPWAADLGMDEFVSLGFTHHIEIMNKAKTLEERCFYIREAVQNHWDKYRLREMLKSDLFHHQDNLPNNFTTKMQNTRNALQAIGMFKDEYLLDFINVEELGVRDEADIDER